MSTLQRVNGVLFGATKIWVQQLAMGIKKSDTGGGLPTGATDAELKSHYSNSFNKPGYNIWPQ